MGTVEFPIEASQSRKVELAYRKSSSLTGCRWTLDTYTYTYIYTHIASVKSTMLVISELDCQLAAHMHEQWVHFPTRATRSRPAPRMWKSFSRLVYSRQILTANWSARLAFMEFGQFVQVDKSIRGDRITTSFFKTWNSLRNAIIE